MDVLILNPSLESGHNSQALKPFLSKCWCQYQFTDNKQEYEMSEVMERPKLTVREETLLTNLQIMKLWVSHKLEPVMSGTGEPYQALKRDLARASKAIEEATGGRES